MTRLTIDPAADVHIPSGRMLIDGQWVPGSAGTSVVENPATEQPVGEVAEATVADAAAAAAAARAAQPGWARLDPAERAGILSRIAVGIRERSDELAHLSMLEGGFTRNMARGNAVRAAEWFDFAAKETATDQSTPTVPSLSRTHDGISGELVNGLIQRRPVGVAAILVSFNGPLYGVSMKSAQALAMGNTVVVKPAQQDPLTVCALFEIMQAAGMPPGVVNLVLGSDPEVAAELTRSADVDLVSFTGSTAVGTRIYQAGAATMKRLVLELGGKGACLIFDDADVDAAVRGLSHPWVINSGQICSAPTRALVHRRVRDQLIERMAALAPTLPIGSPFADDTVLGPVISDQQRTRIEGYVTSAIAEGAEVITGGSRPDIDRGYFVAPTLLDRCHNDMTAVREEIFGPVITAIEFDDEDEAIAIANDTIYGLANYVYTRDTARGYRVASQLQSGTVQVNTTAIKLDMPRGGFKMSGLGREGGRDGLYEFTEMASVVWA